MANKNKKNKTNENSVKNRKNNILFAFVISIILIFMVCVLYAQAQEKLELDNQIQAINEEINKAEDTTKRLQEQMDYQDSDEFVEELARERLNLVMPNEIVFVDKNK